MTALTLNRVVAFDLETTEAPAPLLRDAAGAHRVERAPIPRAPREPGGYRMAWANAQRNGRLTAPLPAWEWEPAWSVELDPDFPPMGLLESTGRVFVPGAAWLLLDGGAGEVLARGRGGHGAWLLDPGRQAVYGFGADHHLSALELEDGSPRFRLLTSGGSHYRHDLLVRAGDRLLLAGTEWRRSAHGPDQPEASLLESLPLPEEVEVDALGRWVRPPSGPALHFMTTAARFAVGPGSVLLAAPGHVAFFTPELELEAAYHGGTFTPLGLASDELGRAFLTLERDGGTELWVLLPSGVRVVRADLPRDAVVDRAPPLVGYDHAVYLASPSRLLALDPGGAQRWSVRPRGPLGGVAVTPDDLLLASEADRVVAYDPTGARRQLHHFDGDRLVTPPLLTSTGTLLVASRARLYALTPQA